MKKLTKEEFIERSRKIHGDLYDYSKVEYINSNTKIIISDPVHGDFKQTPHNHLRGRGCPERGINKSKLIKEEFIEKARKVHNDLYDYSKVVYTGTHNKVIIIDPIYGEYEQVAYYHLNGHGNPLRGNNKLRSSKEEFIKKANNIHNNFYDYSKVEYINTRSKVIIIDPIHGEFSQTPKNHLLGYGYSFKNFNHNNETDHIIPISIIFTSTERKRSINKKRPLYKLLDSDENKKLVSRKDNQKKKDKIILNGKEILGRNHRNNYIIIKQLLLEYTKIEENIIDNIISEDKEWLKTNDKKIF